MSTGDLQIDIKLLEPMQLSAQFKEAHDWITEKIAGTFYLPAWMVAGRRDRGRLKAKFMIEKARVPHTLKPQDMGPWVIERRRADQSILGELGLLRFPDFTLLRRYTEATLMKGGEVVMEDSWRELSRHLPIWMVARGHVLITGLGLGCVVRGLLSNPQVVHIDVVELDRRIIKAIGPEFADNPRVKIHHGDALTIAWESGTKWDYAWHDIWSEQGHGHLCHLHARLLIRYHDMVSVKQGAWQIPREVRRTINVLGNGKNQMRPRR